METNLVRLRVWGEFACFTRPDLKVERMTYPCMTPSAARGILDSILWKPEFVWQVQRILVLKPVKFASVKRNEINKKQGRAPIIIEKNRAQRNSIVLRDVAYIIEASVSNATSPVANPTRKYVEMFNRRVSNGQCWRRPYLGTREFAAEFAPPEADDTPITDNIHIGSMFLDMWYDASGVAYPKFFYDVAVRGGVLDCRKEYDQILSSSHLRGGVAMYSSQMLHELNFSEEGDEP
ncbi:MAG: type I-C CRISPR-associated protein Cas5c [Bacteroidota bacterium]